MDQQRIKHVVNFVARLVAVICLTSLTASPSATLAQTIVDEWSGIKVPPAPWLKRVMVDSKVTALLVIDIQRQNCSSRPRCVGAIGPFQEGLEVFHRSTAGSPS
jgi:hypothetical protein